MTQRYVSSSHTHFYKNDFSLRQTIQSILSFFYFFLSAPLGPMGKAAGGEETSQTGFHPRHFFRPITAIAK
jgi:hypothetical protein